MKTSTPEATRGRFRFSAAGVLFGLNMLLAAALLGLVAFAPWLQHQTANPNGWYRLFLLFSQDAAVRRTALAAAGGLVVTAWVFFRAPVAVKGAAPRTVRPHLMPSNVVGA